MAEQALRSRLAGLALLGLGLMLGACDNSSAHAAIDPDALAGKWNLTQVRRQVEVKTTPPSTANPDRVSDTTLSLSGVSAYIRFNADKSYVAVYPILKSGTGGTGSVVGVSPATEETGTWTLDGATVTTLSSLGKTVQLQADIQGAAGVFVFVISESYTAGDHTTSTTNTLTYTAAKE